MGGECSGYVSEASCAERRAATHKVCSERHKHEFPIKEDYDKDMAEIKTLKADKDTMTASMKTISEGNKGTRLLIYVVLGAIIAQVMATFFAP